MKAHSGMQQHIVTNQKTVLSSNSSYYWYWFGGVAPPEEDDVGWSTIWSDTSTIALESLSDTCIMLI